MKALILAGGEGKRLKPLTIFLPKILLPICNKPLLCHLLSSLAKQKAIDGVTLSLGNLGEKVVSFLSSYNPPLPLEIKIEEQPLDTGGAIKFSAPLEEEFLVINGDIVCDVDYEAMLDFHRRKKADITILMVKVRDISSFGSLLFDGEFKVRGFEEKMGEKRGGFVNGAIYFMKRRVLEHFPQGKCSLEKEIFPRLVSEGVNIYAFPYLGYWMDIGERERYIQIHKDVLDGIVLLDYPSFSYKLEEGVEIYPPVLLGEGCKLKKGAKLSPYSIIGNDVEVGEKASIGESVIFDGARIGEGSKIFRSLVGGSCLLPPNVFLENTILV